METSSTQIEKVRDLLKTFSTAMLITREGRVGALHARPMAIADIRDPFELWFITQRGSAKVDEIEDNAVVHVVCQKDHSAYISLSGRASLIADRSQVEKVWREPFRVWFPDGKDDPTLILIKVTPERAEYWDNKGLNRISYLWEAAIAYAIGDTPRVHEGEQHGVVQMAP
jgi:general stress protein 26